jgi:hypothetical protein
LLPIKFKVHGLLGSSKFVLCLPLRLFSSFLADCIELSDKLLSSLPSPSGKSVVFSEILGYLERNGTVMRKPLPHVGVESRIRRNISYIVLWGPICQQSARIAETGVCGCTDMERVLYHGQFQHN